MSTRQDPRIAAIEYEDEKAERRAAEVRQAIGSGLVITNDDLETVELAGGVEALRNKKTQRFIKETPYVAGKVRISSVMLSDDGERVAVYYRDLSVDEQDELHRRGERAATTAKVAAAIDQAWANVFNNVKVVPVTKMAAPRVEFSVVQPATLDDLDRLIAETGATIKVVRQTALLVSVRDPDVVRFDASMYQPDAKKFDRLEVGRIKSTLNNRAGRYSNAVHALTRAVDDLGDLALKYSKDKKRPKADVGKGTANRLGPGGIWLS